MSQVYLSEKRGSTNWGDRKSNKHKSNQNKCWFLVRGQNGSSWEKNLSEQSREPTNSTYIGRPIRESNPEHIGGRPVLSPLLPTICIDLTQNWVTDA